MSSYCGVYVDGDEILAYRNMPPSFLIDLFNERDIIHCFGSKAAKISKRYGLDDLTEWLEDDNENEMVLLVVSAKLMKKRLSIYGLSDKLQKDVVKPIFDEYESFLEECIEENYNDIEYRDSLKKKLSELRDYRKNGDDKIDVVERIRNNKSSWEQDWIIDLLPEEIILYSAIKNLDDSENVILDYSEFGNDERLDLFKYNNKKNSPIIVAEGKNDLKVLRKSLEIIYPELVDNIIFLDILNFNIEGSAGDVVKIIKSFAGARIKNRVLAILDNDTAAKSALRAINKKRINLPNNIKIIQYPELDFLKNYPTIDPQGELNMDINGVAGSIEMYLGKDALTDEEGHLEKVIWRAYIEGVGKYQGVLMNKNNVNKRFEELLKKVKNENYQYDFSSLTILWDYIISELETIPMVYDLLEVGFN